MHTKLAVLVALGLLAANMYGPVVASTISNTSDDINIGEFIPVITLNANTTDLGSQINDTETETAFINLFNKERKSHGLQPVQPREELTAMGEAHSQDMAAKDYFNHTEPDGDTISDRYRNRGLLPECRIPTGNGRYYEGAENIAQTWVHTPVREEDRTRRIGTSDELASALFEQWMNSPPHRDAMLTPNAGEAGLGLAITDENQVYASLELC